MTLDVDGKPLTVVLAPAPRMEFRDLTEDMLKPGMTVSVVGYRSKARAGEFRARALPSRSRRSTCGDMATSHVARDFTDVETAETRRRGDCLQRFLR